MCEQNEPPAETKSLPLIRIYSPEGDGMADAKLQQCIAECSNCQETCLATLAHCLTLGGKHAEAEHIRVMLDCAEICQVAANFMLRRSTLHTYICRTCAEICEKCAQSCEAIAGEDKQIKRCVESCRRCAESCRDMAGLSYQAA